MTSESVNALSGAHVVVTRPVGSGAPLARRIEGLGGRALLLPGLALRPVADTAFATRALVEAMAGDVMIFTSPAAVRFASQLQRLQTGATVMAIGAATARALVRAGVGEVLTPPRAASSEGLLEHPRLARPQGERVALIGAAGGRQVLAGSLHQRGARLREIYVYRRTLARLGKRHSDAVQALPADSYALLTSADTLSALRQVLPATAWAHLRTAVAVVSSERLAAAAGDAGFARVERAASATGDDLLRALVALHRRT